MKKFVALVSLVLLIAPVACKKEKPTPPPAPTATAVPAPTFTPVPVPTPPPGPAVCWWPMPPGSAPVCKDANDTAVVCPVGYERLPHCAPVR